MSRPTPTASHDSLWTVFGVFLRLGLTSFGGPVAHLGFFRDEFVQRRQWLSERSYADLVALCQFLPGPASSQVGMALGLTRRGYRGALAAWLGFTLPSALLMAAFALSLSGQWLHLPPSLLHGLKLAAVAVVAQAVWGMARHLCKGLPHLAIMTAACCAVLLAPGALTQLAVIVGAGLLGLLLFRPEAVAAHEPLPQRVSHRAGLLWLGLFLMLLISLPLAAGWLASPALAYANAFYRCGALVFGGGHVMLPLLQEAVVAPGWVSKDSFLAGYGAAQALPGPLFTFAAFLGASMKAAPTGLAGAALCLLSIFAPSFLLVAGAMPFWEGLRRHARTQAALQGINASVVGLLLAALYQPVWTSAIHEGKDFGLALLAFVALTFWRVPPWLLVLGCAAAGALAW